MPDQVKDSVSSKDISETDALKALKRLVDVAMKHRDAWNRFCADPAGDLGLGDLAFEDSPLPLLLGGTGATTAAGARTNLGLGDLAVENSPLALAKGGTGAALADPNADRFPMWDDSAGGVVFFPQDSTIRTGTVDWGVTAATTSQSGRVTLADQDTMEAGTNAFQVVTASRAQYHQSAGKFWAEVDGDGVGIDASYNVASIDDDGTGRIGVNFTTAFSSTTYAAGGIAQRASTSLAEANMRHVQIRNGTQAVGSIDFECFDQTGTTAVAKDPTKHYVWGFGDQ